MLVIADSPGSALKWRLVEIEVFIHPSLWLAIDTKQTPLRLVEHFGVLSWMEHSSNSKRRRDMQSLHRLCERPVRFRSNQDLGMLRVLAIDLENAVRHHWRRTLVILGSGDAELEVGLDGVAFVAHVEDLCCVVYRCSQQS